MTKELWAGFADDDDVVMVDGWAFTVGALRTGPSLAAAALAWWRGWHGGQVKEVERQLHEEHEKQSKGGRERTRKIQQKAEDDWGDIVRAMLQNDARTQVQTIVRKLVGQGRATDADEDKIGRFVRRIRGKKPVCPKKSARLRRPAT
jgi:hypothetical protein